MKKDFVSAWIVTAAIVISVVGACVYVHWSFSGFLHQMQAYESMQAKTNDNGMVHAYKVRKIEEMADKIIKREAIESTYLRYVEDDRELVEKIQAYNAETGSLLSFFTNGAIGVVITQCMLKDKDGNDLSTDPSHYVEIPAELHTLIDRIATYALYENCAELMYADAGIEQITAPLAGGSYGMWPNNFQGWVREIKPDGMGDYFALVDGLLTDLENYRSGFLTIP